MSPALTLATSMAVALVAALLVPARVGLRGAGPAAPPDPVSGERAVLTRLRIPLTGLGFAAAWAFLGGPLGLVGGALAALAAWRVLGRVESPALRRRREQLARDLPVGVDLLGAVLAAGGAVDNALAEVAEALPGPLADEFGLIRHRLDLGADPGSVWQGVARHPQLAPLGRAMARAHESGASVGAAIALLAAELRETAQAEVEERARAVAVRGAAPLGVCFLPAFVLLGVVPMVVGIFSSMALFG